MVLVVGATGLVGGEVCSLLAAKREPVSFAGLMLAYAHGDVIDMTKTLQDFPMRLASVRDYAKRVLAV